MDEAVRVRQSRSVEQRGRGRTLHQPARIHDRNLVGELHQQGQVVRDEQSGKAEPVAQADQLLEDLPLGDDVEGGGRLVQDHDLRLERQRYGDHRSLSHAAGQLVGIAAQPVGVDPHHVEQLSRPLQPRRSRELWAVHAKQVVELRADGDHGVERVHRALQDDRDLRPPDRAQLLLVRSQHVDGPFGPVSTDRLGVEQDLPAGDHGRRAKEADRGEGQRGLAAAAFAREAEHLATPKDEVAIHDRVDGLVAVAVIDAEPTDLEHGVSHVLRAGCQ